MENMTVSDLAVAAAGAAAAAGAGVHDGVARTIVTVLLVGVALVIAFTFCALPLLGFVSTGIAAGSIAAAWMASIGVVAAGSLFALLQAIAMGGAPVFLVLLGIVAVVAAAVGAFEAIDWLLHAVDVMGWWHSATDWVVHLWGSVDPSPLGWWHSATDWVVHLWDSIPAHHKWKILYT